MFHLPILHGIIGYYTCNNRLTILGHTFFFSSISYNTLYETLSKALVWYGDVLFDIIE